MASSQEPESAHSYPPWAKDCVTRDYVQKEWQQVPRTQQALFEHLCLLIFHSGLGWSLVLRKRQELADALDGFNQTRLAGWGEPEIAAYLTGKQGIRNESKLRACLTNASLFDQTGLQLADLLSEALPDPIWVESVEKPPQRLEATDELAKRLTEMGFARLGPVTLCALAQAAGYIRFRSG